MAISRIHAGACLPEKHREEANAAQTDSHWLNRTAALLAGALYAVAVQAQPPPAPNVDPGSAL
jgi:hypothetical protein